MRTGCILVLPLFGFIASCGGTCQREAFGKPVISPDGRYQALILRENCGTTDPFNFLVAVSEGTPGPGEAVIVFSSIRAAPVVRWVSQTEIGLDVGKALPRYLRAHWNDISIIATVSPDVNGRPRLSYGSQCRESR